MKRKKMQKMTRRERERMGGGGGWGGEGKLRGVRKKGQNQGRGCMREREPITATKHRQGREIGREEERAQVTLPHIANPLRLTSIR